MYVCQFIFLMSVVCTRTRMSFVCHSYELVCQPYVTIN